MTAPNSLKSSIAFFNGSWIWTNDILKKSIENLLINLVSTILLTSLITLFSVSSSISYLSRSSDVQGNNLIFRVLKIVGIEESKLPLENEIQMLKKQNEKLRQELKNKLEKNL